MPDQLPSKTKKERAAALRAMIAKKKRNFLESLLMLPVMHVVFEDGKQEDMAGNECSSFARGVNEYYVDCRSGFRAREHYSGVLTPVRPLGLQDEVLLVEPLRVGE